ncbi:fructose-6-phosphate aldolase [Planomicrobium sp. CPCC 101110]|uniref:fructose-6-phosphate aldolase n=1 Tax=Planomicrobium sp. CPCC 101110 TaxID=2599619 RepID=UPI0011B853E6|nr:fructose-6-phosphate aldolase [Planomicrobium sp. CPCC 101110]TWT25410.1 fructose-6-phosphate aldolase [Planomicrobium sp. CPCC 101110]
MELMFDTGNIEKIEYYSQVFPIAGVTTNPSILKKEGKVEIWEHFRQIQKIIGEKTFLHVQVTTGTKEEIIKEAYKIVEELGYETYVKIPTTIEGLQAVKVLKKENFKITATAIYTMAQGDFAIMAGADYIAPYFNRMENINIEPERVIKHYAHLIKANNKETKILAASFKNMGQVMSAYEWGAHCTTVDPDLLADALKMPSIEEAVINFKSDWESSFGKGVSLLDV